MTTKIIPKLKLNDNPIGFYKINDESYFKAPGVSNSDLSLFLRSPAHYETFKLKNIKRQDTKSLNFGRALHTFALERHLFESLYVVAPKFDRRTKVGQAAAELFETQNADRTYITEEEFIAIIEIGKKIDNYKHEGKFWIKDYLLAEGHNELAMFWRDKTTNMLCRGKCDYIKNDGSIVDIKTTKSASQREFAKSIAVWGYHRQAAYYLWGASQITGLDFNKFTFIAIEKEAPYEISIFEADPRMLDQGFKEIRKALDGLDKCSVTGKFYGYQPAGPELIGLPNWAQIEDENEGVNEL